MPVQDDLEEVLAQADAFLVARREREHLDDTVFARLKMATERGGRDPARDMTNAHAFELLTKYPTLYREGWIRPSAKSSPFARDGFSVSDGWFSILNALSAKLAPDLRLSASQVKEKMGRLTVYIDTDGGADATLDAVAEQAIKEAADLSVKTCEICGAPGVQQRKSFLVTVRCATCEAAGL